MRNRYLIAVAGPLTVTGAVAVMWPWAALIILLPAILYAGVIGFVALARSDRDWGLFGSGLVPLASSVAGWWAGKTLRNLLLG